MEKPEVCQKLNLRVAELKKINGHNCYDTKMPTKDFMDDKAQAHVSVTHHPHLEFISSLEGTEIIRSLKN